MSDLGSLLEQIGDVKVLCGVHDGLNKLVDSDELFKSISGDSTLALTIRDGKYCLVYYSDADNIEVSTAFMVHRICNKFVSNPERYRELPINSSIEREMELDFGLMRFPNSSRVKASSLMNGTFLDLLPYILGYRDICNEDCDDNSVELRMRYDADSDELVFYVGFFRVLN